MTKLGYHALKTCYNCSWYNKNSLFYNIHLVTKRQRTARRQRSSLTLRFASVKHIVLHSLNFLPPLAVSHITSTKVIIVIISKSVRRCNKMHLYVAHAVDVPLLSRFVEEWRPNTLQQISSKMRMSAQFAFVVDTNCVTFKCRWTRNSIFSFALGEVERCLSSVFKMRWRNCTINLITYDCELFTTIYLWVVNPKHSDNTTANNLYHKFMVRITNYN